MPTTVTCHAAGGGCPALYQPVKLGLRCNWPKRLRRAPFSHKNSTSKFSGAFSSRPDRGTFSSHIHAQRHQQQCLTAVSNCPAIPFNDRAIMRRRPVRPSFLREVRRDRALRPRKFPTAVLGICADGLQSTRLLATALWRTCRGSALPATGVRSSRK